MLLPDFKLVGKAGRFKNGHGKRSQNYSQKFRLLAEPPRKVRSVSLKTSDVAIARRRAVAYVEERIREIIRLTNPEVRTSENGIQEVLQEYIDDLTATGNTKKQADLVKKRIERIIAKAQFKQYAHVDSVIVTKAIADLHADGVFKSTNTANKYLEAMRAWSRWMFEHERWPTDSLALAKRIKGDTSNSRPRAILADNQFEKLLLVTRQGPPRRNLTGEQRFWLYLIASQTGLRAQELHSLMPKSFHLAASPPYVEVHCTISKRRKADRIELRRDFSEMLQGWLNDKPRDRRLWAESASWYYKAADMLRHDLDDAGLPHHAETNEGDAVVDFHSFRAYRVTRTILTGKSSRVVMATVRLSSEKLLERYCKIPTTEITECVEAVPLPNLKSD